MSRRGPHHNSPTAMLYVLHMHDNNARPVGTVLYVRIVRTYIAEIICMLMDRGFSKDPGDPETHWHRDDEAVGVNTK